MAETCENKKDFKTTEQNFAILLIFYKFGLSELLFGSNNQ